MFSCLFVAVCWLVVWLWFVIYRLSFSVFVYVLYAGGLVVCW